MPLQQAAHCCCERALLQVKPAAPCIAVVSAHYSRSTQRHKALLWWARTTAASWWYHALLWSERTTANLPGIHANYPYITACLPWYSHGSQLGAPVSDIQTHTESLAVFGTDCPFTRGP